MHRIRNDTKHFVIAEHNNLSLSNLCTGEKRATSSRNGLHGEAPPEKGTIFRLHVYKRVRISLFEAYERVGKSVIAVCGRTCKG